MNALDQPEFTVEDLLQLLADRHRGVILQHLSDGSSDVATVPELIHALQGDPGIDAERTSLEIALHHHHLPKLADAGLIDYRQGGDKVEYYEDPLLEEVLVDNPKERRERTE